MKNRRMGTVLQHHGYWFYAVRLPGTDKRRMYALRAPNATHGLSADRPRRLAEEAAWRLWEQHSEKEAKTRESGGTVDDICDKYSAHAASYYRGGKNGDAEHVFVALRPFRRLFGGRAISELTHADMLALRDAYVASGVARVTVNRRIAIVKRMMSWALDEALIPAVVKAELSQVKNLKRGRSAAREVEPVREVCDEDVEKAISMMMPNLADMVRVQRLTGMRPGELCDLTFAQIDRSAMPWVYRPVRHKNAWRGDYGMPRAIVIGPRARAILEVHACEPDEHPFSPMAAIAERLKAIRAARKTKVQPSQINRSVAGAAHKPGPSWNTRAYCSAVANACRKAGCTPWHPNQLRHAFATEVRRKFGYDACRAVLGHAMGARITDRYSYAAIEDEMIKAASPAVEALG